MEIPLKVVASEAGGITQGIGAYQVLVQVDGDPQACIFLDTPGHEVLCVIHVSDLLLQVFHRV